MTRQSLTPIPENVKKRLVELEKAIAELNNELVGIKIKYRIDKYCCDQSQYSNGWHHDPSCPNLRMVD